MKKFVSPKMLILKYLGWSAGYEPKNIIWILSKTSNVVTQTTLFARFPLVVQII